MIKLSDKIKSNAEAHAAKQVAKKLRINAKDSDHPDIVATDLKIANMLEADANAHLTLKYIPERGTGGELITYDVETSKGTANVINGPDRVSADASLDRLDLIEQSGILNMALDNAESVGAKTSAEQMIAHQMAAAHRTCLELMLKAVNTRDTIEKVRLLNVAARFMDLSQKAALTIHRLHTSGQQTVTVQHVQVQDGAQAIINGNVGTGGAKFSDATSGKKK